MQKSSTMDNLSLSSLNKIFNNLTSLEEELHASAKKKNTSKFVKNSGIVLYDTSDSDISSEDESVDIVNDSPPDSPVFRIPPKSSAMKDTSSRFKPPSTKAELQFLSCKTFAKSTDRKIEWAANLFRMWRKNRIHEGTGEGEILWCDLDRQDLDPEVLAHVLPTFINKIKRADGEDYPPNMVYSIIVMLQLFFEKKGKMWKLLDGKIFNSVRNTVDNIMKHQSMERIAQKVKRSEPISITDEEEMWDFGILGEESPECLRNTVMYLIGLTFVLRGGKEHRSLRNPHFNPQIIVKTSDKSGRKFLEYTEDMVSKTNQGRLSGRKLTPKVVKAFGNPNPQRDIVRLYQKYVSLCPPEPKSDALYKYGICESKHRPCQWFSDKPLGINAISKCVPNLMTQAGKSGNYTNHSLRVTAATRMFENGIEEQLVKEKTGHKSDAICAYKRTSDSLMAKAEKAVICSGEKKMSEGPKEFDIDDDIASFDLFCMKKYPKSTKSCCSNALCRMFGGDCIGKRKVKKLKFSVKFDD